MTTKQKLNVLFSAALSGAAGAIAVAVGDPQHFSLSHWQTLVGPAVGGAVLGIVNHLRQSPLDK